jgi:hypothetical protein
MPIDYSAWEKIEVSDDENETHPNIDDASLFRWRHQARLERMELHKLAKEELKSIKEKSAGEVQVSYLHPVAITNFCAFRLSSRSYRI